MTRATSLLALLIIAAVGLGACGGSATTPAVSAGSPPLGTYVQVGSNPHKLTLQDGGRYLHDIPIMDLHLVGTWTATPAQLSFTENAGGQCPNVTGTYTWSYTGTTLHLTLVADECTGRPASFGLPEGWVKQP